ncbi:MAG: DivIVA domain-containing protein [Ruminococcus sp.]|nr:DivIVA domain-containing protein [Ruminococcus sp.]
MNGTEFIKTVVFGGYDKADTDEHIQKLYRKISKLETELEIMRLLNGKSGTIPEETGKKLSEAEAENKKLTYKVSTLTAENSTLEIEVKNLKKTVEELESKLSERDMKIMSLSQEDDTEVFGVVFASARKSAEEIVETARKKAENLKADSERLAHNIVAEANNKASEIVYEAELYASEMTAEVDKEELSAIPENIRSVILGEVNKISDYMENFRETFSKFFSVGNDILDKSGDILDDTRRTVLRGGVPVFRDIEKYVDLPEKPVREAVDYSYSAEKKVKEKAVIPAEEKLPEKPVKKYDPVAEYYNSQDYTVQNTHDFDAYDYDYNYDENSPDFKNIDKTDSMEDDFSVLVSNVIHGAGGINLRALDRQEEEFMNIKKKNGEINLDELTAQAEALENDDLPKVPEKKVTENIDLASLMAQAEALEDL